MSIWTRLASGHRATPTTTSGRKLPGLGAGLGMTIKQPSGGSLAATQSVTYATPGQPKYPEWDAQLATRDYLANIYVMRSFRVIADTIAGLAFQTGLDPENPSDHGASPLSQLLGPASPQAPGGPNKLTSSRAMWAWSIVQYLVTGRLGWEQQRDPATRAFDGNKAGQIFALWPLVCACLAPVPAPDGAPRWFDGFEYQTPRGKRDMTADKVFYAWRASAKDWREPESALQAMQTSISIVNGINAYMWSLLKNDMVASKIIISPPFDEDDQRRAWQDQFVSEFSGFDNAGKSIFAEAEQDIDETTGKALDNANAKVQVIDLAQTGINAQLMEMLKEGKIDITIGTGVPISLLGNASQRTYANADSEYRNFWTITVLPLLSELQDPVNVQLAPQLGDEVGWFDLSRVVALQPPSVFMPPAVTDMIDAGVITPDDVANILNLPSLENPSEDAATAPVGEEAIQSGAMGGRSWTQQHEGYRAVHHGMRLAPNVFAERKPLNTHTLKSGVWKVVRRRERVVTSGHRAEVPQLATEVVTTVERMRRRRQMGYRSSSVGVSGIAVKAQDTGRVLMLQRALDDTDPASGKLEFPGGHVEAGEDSQDAAQREWQEEVGMPLPVGNVAGSWTNGIYRGHVHVVPAESGVVINPDRPKVRNPDHPRGKYQETAVWMDPDHISDNPAVRDEVKSSASTWLPVVKAAQSTEGVRSDFGSWFDANSERLEALVS
ncbi:MAG: phage portal protein family [Acidimicrobiaceae bacterium]|nr:phage portal protein family [Acidimicrobiaceae bacterium]